MYISIFNFYVTKTWALDMLLSHEFYCSYFWFSLSLLCPALGNFCVYFPAEWETVTILLKVMEGFELFLIFPDFHQSSFQKSLFYQCLRLGQFLVNICFVPSFFYFCLRIWL